MKRASHIARVCVRCACPLSAVNGGDEPTLCLDCYRNAVMDIMRPSPN